MLFCKHTVLFDTLCRHFSFVFCYCLEKKMFCVIHGGIVKNQYLIENKIVKKGNI